MNARLHIQVARNDHSSFIKNVFSSQPFKLADITENKHASKLRLMLMSSSPGVLDGDTYDMHIELAEGSCVQLETQSYQRLFNIIYSNLPEPDLLVYLHCNVDRLMKNIAKRGREYEQKIPADYLTQIQETYFSYLKSQTHLRIVVLDVSEIDFVNDGEVYKRIKQIINQDYKPGIHYPELRASTNVSI